MEAEFEAVLTLDEETFELAPPTANGTDAPPALVRVGMTQYRDAAAAKDVFRRIANEPETTNFLSMVDVECIHVIEVRRGQKKAIQVSDIPVRNDNNSDDCSSGDSSNIIVLY